MAQRAGAISGELSAGGLPGAAGDAIEHVALHRVAAWDARMIELFREDEAKLFHDAAGPCVAGNGEGDDFRKPETFETIAQGGLTGFGGEAAAPEFGAQSVAELDAGGEVRFKGNPTEAEGAGEFAVDLYGPGAEAVAREVILDALPHGLGIIAREDGGEKFHDAGIGAQGGQRLEVVIGPVAQAQAGCLDLCHIGRIREVFS